MRIFIIGIALLASCILLTLYVYGLQKGTIALPLLKIMLWSAISALALLTMIFPTSFNDFELVFLSVSKSLILCTGLVAILIATGYLKNNPYQCIGLLYLGTALATGLILVSGGRHGLFKD